MSEPTSPDMIREDTKTAAPTEETRTVPRELTDADVEEILYQLNRKERGDPWTAEKVRDLYRTFLFVAARYPKATS